MTRMGTTLLIIALLSVGYAGFRFRVYRWRRPRLRHPVRPQGPALVPIAEMASQLAGKEAAEPRIIPGAEALITYADPAQPGKTAVSYLYLHGLSACRQETAPVTERLAAADGANAVYGRIAGHGMGDKAMSEVDGGAWLESVWEYWTLAQALGERVVIVATSTGVASAVWLLEQEGVPDRVKALLCLAPNIQVRNPWAPLLTWPGVDYWLPQIVSPEKRWRSRDPRQDKYWSTNYGNQALIQMQLLLNYVRHVPVETLQVPLMVQCSPEDPVINPRAAYRWFKRWGGQPKIFRWVEAAPDESGHVFVGDIMAPHRNDDVIQAFRAFLESLPD